MNETLRRTWPVVLVTIVALLIGGALLPESNPR